MKYIIVRCIDIYQIVTAAFRALTGARHHCVFYPTCSSYAREAVVRHGAVRGMQSALRRVLRCHPWQRNVIDLP